MIIIQWCRLWCWTGPISRIYFDLPAQHCNPPPLLDYPYIMSVCHTFSQALSFLTGSDETWMTIMGRWANWKGFWIFWILVHLNLDICLCMFLCNFTLTFNFSCICLINFSLDTCLQINIVYNCFDLQPSFEVYHSLQGVIWMSSLCDYVCFFAYDFSPACEINPRSIVLLFYQSERRGVYVSFAHFL